MTKTSAELLASIRRERGYLLSYHHVFATLDPTFMEAYDDLYRASLLDRRFLTAKERELIWVGIVALAQEDVGEIHLRRAHEAGASHHEIEAAFALAGAATTWAPLSFACDRWPTFVSTSGEALYDRAVQAARPPLDSATADLILLVLHGVRREERPFLLHLGRLVREGVPETHIAEGLSYLLQPLGANTMLWATDTWLRALRDGVLPPSPALGNGVIPDVSP